MASDRGPQASLIRFSIEFRGLILTLAVVLLGYGIFTLSEAKYDVFPEFTPPQVSIQTEAPGLTPEQVEILVTQPVENSVNGMPGLQKLTSNSIQGLSVIRVIFDPNTDIYRDRQLVAERIADVAGHLPGAVDTPKITPLTSATSTVLVVGVTSETRSPMELRTTADWLIRPRLLAVPGVARVSIFGGEQKSFQIQIRPDDLIRFGLGVNDVLEAARRATGLRGTGFIDTPNQRILLQTEERTLTAIGLARSVIVSHNGIGVTLGDIGNVIEAPVNKISAASIMGQEGVVIDISDQYGANTIDLTKRLEAALEDLRPTLAADGIELHANLFRPANFIHKAISNVGTSLFLGGILVVAVLFLFLFDLRTAAISCATIPLSLLAAVIIVERSGGTLNTMTLAGLAIAIGVVVDDAVVDIDNIVRRLRENGRLAQPRGTASVILDACLEVRGAVVYATFAVVTTVLPIMTLSGLAARLFAPLGSTFVVAVLASLAVTLTVTPALSILLLSNTKAATSDPPLIRWLRPRYENILSDIISRPRALIITTVLILLGGLAALPFLGGEFIPELKEGHFILHMSAMPGTSIDESTRLGGIVTKTLRNLPIVQSVAQRVGRAEQGDDIIGTHSSEFEIELTPMSGTEAETAQAKIRQAVAAIPGPNFSLNTFLTERIDETVSGYVAPVVIEVIGNNLDLLDEKAGEIAGILNQIRGAKDVQLQSPPGMPQVMIRVRNSDLARWGFTTLDVRDAIHTAYDGEIVGQVYDGDRVFPIIANLAPESRQSISDVGNLLLRSPEGNFVRLSQLADIAESSGRYQIVHQSAQRLASVTANVSGRDVASFVRDAKMQIQSRVVLPPGNYVSFSGTAEAEAESRYDLLINSVIAMVGVVLLLSIITKSARNLALVLANLPFALVGGILAAFIGGGTLTVGSLVGFITLFGMTLRNSILMISHYEHLVTQEGMAWEVRTAISGAADRLPAIMMTSLVTALGVLPLALGMNAPGREIEGPMAVVILGGLLTSMVLNLLVLPTLALRFGHFSAAGAPTEATA